MLNIEMVPILYPQQWTFDFKKSSERRKNIT